MNLYSLILIGILVLLPGSNKVYDDQYTAGEPHLYLQNRFPLVEKPLLELPLGAIKPMGWLRDQLIRMKNGMTGHLDEIYPQVLGPRNGWLGGDGDGWERGPYWIDGLLPLAYLLDDKDLLSKVKPWIEWTLSNQTVDGYIGPVPFESQPDPEPGLQRGNRLDWWPKMVMLKILQQYYSASGDQRVIECLTKYFKYQREELPNTPLDHLTLWANRRGGDNLMVVLWLYNITGEEFLLELGKIIAEQTFPWAQIYTNKENYDDPADPWHYSRVMKRYPFDPDQINALRISQIGGMHCVNVAQGLKEPIVDYQQSHDRSNIDAVKKALYDLKKYHGQPQGMYGGDEPLHGKNPVQGIEFCSISEEMFSLETIIPITGDMFFADQLEKITYNALPTQANDDFTQRQYFQAANQVELSDRINVSFQTHGHRGTDFVFGVLSGYPCCTTNMHQSWPKFVQNLFYATNDRGVAAIQYAPAEVSLVVGDSTRLTVLEDTGFPFREDIRFSLSLDKSDKFPFALRIPKWTKNAVIKINGTKWKGEIKNQLATINRIWKNGDKIELILPMHLKHSSWYQFARTIERGPLVYSLKIDSREVAKNRNDHFGSFTEVYPTTDWNFGLIQSDIKDLKNNVEVVVNQWEGQYPWNESQAPVQLRMRGIKIPEWQEVNGVPYLPAAWGRHANSEQLQIEEITLIPYGCTTLRITEFPVYDY